jgi:biopolymer transport protein ExbD
MTRRKRPGAEPVEPSLPITPMLDMSFQLMAFFILTFRPMPTEAQLGLSLPKEAGGPSQVAPANPLDVEDDELVVQVTAADNGGVAEVVAAPRSGEVKLGPDTGKLFAYLKERAAGAAAEKKPPPKLRLEMADRLSYQFVVKLVDEARRAGFDRISPALLNPGGKKEPAKAGG